MNSGALDFQTNANIFLWPTINHFVLWQSSQEHPHQTSKPRAWWQPTGKVGSPAIATERFCGARRWDFSVKVPSYGRQDPQQDQDHQASRFCSCQYLSDLVIFSDWLKIWLWCFQRVGKTLFFFSDFFLSLGLSPKKQHNSVPQASSWNWGSTTLSSWSWC